MNKLIFLNVIMLMQRVCYWNLLFLVL